ncbi:FAD-binding oxidoreductase [Prauserella muralis]|uniref:FAD-binding protein n=1 Tax=Prauserella muralis TaxID=588067 RepID=A0A2V4AGN5_9PSEU|nr:FAD-binding oxidoreductase [Prauserella muralis]PXY19019.1 FAD-binding protein [Prauserella muralis]TWE28912.1 FAD/FMN-containing dehydrogenase [Prauserella muralis]
MTTHTPAPFSAAPLRDQVAGPVLTPGDPGYDDELSGFQTGARHRPALVVGARAAGDVQAAVGHAAARGLPVAVQATGHGQSATAPEGSVLVTTHRMDTVRVDPDARTAWIGAGTRWQRVIAAAAPYGLAPLSGSAPHVGAVGYTLAGGLGPLARRYGYAADRVRRIEVVTADGLRRTVGARADDADLFWALRGGGGNFGVVTGLQIELVPVARLYGGGLLFSGEHTEQVLQAFRDWTATLPVELTSSLAMVPVPDLPSAPEPLRGRHIVSVRIAFAGRREDGERLMAPLRTAAPLLADTLRELPFTESGSLYNDPDEPHAYLGDNAFVRELDDDALRAIRELAGPGSPVPCVVDVRHLGGALACPPTGGNAVGHRDARYLVRVLSGLDGAVEAEAARAVHDRLLAALARLSPGRALGFVYGRPARASTGYDADTFARLRAVKARYDPRNLFRVNHNIAPGESFVE